MLVNRANCLYHLSCKHQKMLLWTGNSPAAILIRVGSRRFASRLWQDTAWRAVLAVDTWDAYASEALHKAAVVPELRAQLQGQAPLCTLKAGRAGPPHGALDRPAWAARCWILRVAVIKCQASLLHVVECCYYCHRRQDLCWHCP